MEEIIIQAEKHLKNNGVVSLPTETVYSLSANASSDEAIERIYKLKGRRADNPLALLVGSIGCAKEIVEFTPQAEILARNFFPGPLTLILKKKDNLALSKSINIGLDSLGVRMPAHKTTLDILNAVNFPVVGTSANPSGQPPATDYEGVKNYFGDDVDLIIDGGAAQHGIASTIIDLTGEEPVILRVGSITKEQIDEALACK